MAATLSPEMSHNDKVAHFTGGLSSRLPALPPFAGSERLRSDGRPRPEFRAELRRISNATNAFHVVFTLSLPFLFCGLAVLAGDWPLALAVATYGLVFVAMGSWFQRALTLNPWTMQNWLCPKVSNTSPIPTMRSMGQMRSAFAQNGAYFSDQISTKLNGGLKHRSSLMDVIYSIHRECNNVGLRITESVEARRYLFNEMLGIFESS